jgi:hypothetical protein
MPNKYGKNTINLDEEYSSKAADSSRQRGYVRTETPKLNGRQLREQRRASQIHMGDLRAQQELRDRVTPANLHAAKVQLAGKANAKHKQARSTAPDALTHDALLDFEQQTTVRCLDGKSGPVLRLSRDRAMLGVEIEDERLLRWIPYARLVDPNGERNRLEEVPPDQLRPLAQIAGYRWQFERQDDYPFDGTEWYAYVLHKTTPIAYLMLILHEDRVVLRSIFVHKDFRRGLGGQMLRALLSAYPDLAVRLRVQIDVNDAPLSEEQLHAWYSRHGFIADEDDESGLSWLVRPAVG